MPEIESYNIAQIRENLADIINQVNYDKKRIQIKRHEKIVGYLIPDKDYELLTRVESYLKEQREKKEANADAKKS